MSVEAHAMGPVPESDLKKLIKQFADFGANIITIVNEGHGNFVIEWTFIDEGPQQTITIRGKMSTFGGPHDMDVGEAEGLALYNAAEAAAAPAGLFLDTQPPGTTGLARRLNPAFNYLACRWDYSVTPPEFLRKSLVTVSANGKSVTARPVDWGPNVSTGRVVDLSDGLAHALSLTDTDQMCTVVIPLPDGVAIQAPEGAPIAATDPATIAAASFPADMTRTLVVWTTAANKAWSVVNLAGNDVGGQTLMVQVGNDSPKVLRSDTVILPIKADDDVPAFAAAELNKAVEEEPAGPTGPVGDRPAPGDDINAKLFAAARVFHQDTSEIPNTDGGVNACAWAVNELTRLTLGKPISFRDDKDGTQDSRNGLTTLGMFKALEDHHTKLGSANDAKPGTIIIARTAGAHHGHVGVVGARDGSVGDTPVFSNSSKFKKFMQNYTIAKFEATFDGLEIAFFDLKRDWFV